jgi:O-antigen ligase
MKGFLFTWAIALGGAAASLALPWVGVLTYIFLANLRPNELWRAQQMSGFSDIVGLSLVAGWALSGFGTWRLHKARPIIVILVLFLVWVLLSALQARDQALAWRYVDLQSKIIVPIAIAATIVATPRQLRYLLWAMVLAYGYVSFVMNESYFLNSYNRAEFDGFTGGRAAFCVGLVSAFAPAFYFGFTEKRLWQRALAGVCLVLILHTVLLTFSRGGLLALLVAGAVGVWFMPKRPFNLGVIAATALLGVMLAGPRVYERFDSTFQSGAARDRSAQSRLELWRACTQLMLENPLFGVGPNNAPYYLANRFGFGQGTSGEDREGHTLWLQAGAELGVVGLVLIASYYGLVIWWLLPIARMKVPAHDPTLVDMSRAVIMGLTGFAVAAQFVSLEQLEIPYYLAFVGAGILKVHGTLAEEHAAQVQAAPPVPELTVAAPPVPWAHPAPLPHRFSQGRRA